MLSLRISLARHHRNDGTFRKARTTLVQEVSSGTHCPACYSYQLSRRIAAPMTACVNRMTTVVASTLGNLVKLDVKYWIMFFEIRLECKEMCYDDDSVDDNAPRATQNRTIFAMASSHGVASTLSTAQCQKLSLKRLPHRVVGIRRRLFPPSFQEFPRLGR